MEPSRQKGRWQIHPCTFQTSIVSIDKNTNTLIAAGTCSDISFLKKDNSIIFHVSKFDRQNKLFADECIVVYINIGH